MNSAVDKESGRNTVVVSRMSKVGSQASITAQTGCECCVGGFWKVTEMVSDQ